MNIYEKIDREKLRSELKRRAPRPRGVPLDVLGGDMTFISGSIDTNQRRKLESFKREISYLRFISLDWEGNEHSDVIPYIDDRVRDGSAQYPLLLLASASLHVFIIQITSP